MKGQVSIHVFGMVQGVGFRYFVKRNASKLGLSGYAKNNDDGTVLVVAEGDEADLLIMVELCKQGPPRAFVKEVLVSWGEATGMADFFTI
ncbi:MAG TPA: acylphosphatase [Williamwhitmania sp.]|jgi:acylphosphatase|nr:acylphosphatase [Williamwhitmania sp.]